IRLTFCFSRSCLAYSDALRRRPVDWPCWPGAYARRSTAHFSVRQRVPLRNSLVPSRRHSLQTGPVYRATSNPPLLGRPAPVVRNRRHVADGADLQPRRRERLDGRLASGPRALYAHVHALDAEIERLARRLLGRDRGGERRRLLGALEARLAGRAPGDGVALHVRDGDEGVVERRRDMRDALRLDHLLGAFGAGWFRLGHLLFQHGLLLARDRRARCLLSARS